MTRLTDAPTVPEGMRGEDLRLSYHGTTVVNGAAIALSAGSVTALVGPNGSGKSTLLRCLARLHRPDAGSVAFTDGTGTLALSAKEFAKRVTLLAQSRPTPCGVRVRDVVGYGRHPYRGRWRDNDVDGAARIAWAMDVCGIAAMSQRPVDELSGGERQRVWLATCLAQDTGILLLDEPTRTWTCGSKSRSWTWRGIWPTTTMSPSAWCCTTSTRRRPSPTGWCCCARAPSWPTVLPSTSSPPNTSPTRTASRCWSAPTPTRGY